VSRKPRTLPARIGRAITDAMWEQGLREMRGVDRLLAPLDRRRSPRSQTQARGQKAEMSPRPLRTRAWRGFRAVLCPVDFSEPSRLAFRYAMAIARRSNASLTVLYVNDPLLIAAATVALHDRHIAKRSKRELRAFTEATTRSHESPTPTIVVATGNPADEILARARRSHADLLVVGTHGATGADRLLFGSTTLSLLQRTSIPILAVPSPGETTSTAVPTSWPGQRMIAALELDSQAGHDLEIVTDLAAWFKTSLLLVHIVIAVAAPAWLTGDLTAHDRIRIAQAQQQLDQLAARARKRVKAETRVTCGQPADEIAAMAAAEQTGLVVTALKDRRGWFGARRGSVSYHVLSHAVTPVLAYPPQWRHR